MHSRRLHRPWPRSPVSAMMKDQACAFHIHLQRRFQFVGGAAQPRKVQQVIERSLVRKRPTITLQALIERSCAKPGQAALLHGGLLQLTGIECHVCCESPRTAANPYSSIRPPSTTISAPVMKDASSERRNATVLAISSGRPSRLMGTFAAIRAVCSGFASTKGVRIGPGDTALMRTRRVAYSIAVERVRPRTACLVAV